MTKSASVVLALFSVVAAGGAHACPGIDSAERPTFLRPVGGEVLLGFGMYRHPILGTTRLHTGVDYAAAVGDDVRASAAGQVVVAEERPDYGKYVRLRHSGGFETAYAQLNDIAVHEGDCVDAGALIGHTGPGKTLSHLHFEVLANGRFIDPVRMRGAPQ